jgi:ribonuclease HI
MLFVARRVQLPIPTTDERPAETGARLHQLSSWLWTIIANTGLFLADPTATTNDRVYAATRHPVFDRYEWRHRGDGILQGIAVDQKWGLRAATAPTETISARYRAWGEPVEFTSASGPANVIDDFRLLQNSENGIVIVAGHPHFNHGPTLPPLLHERRSPFDRRTLSGALTASKRTQAHHEQTISLIERRLERGIRDEQKVFSTLQATTRTSYTRPSDGLTIYQQLFRYKLVLGRNIRDGDGKPLPCPHETCATLTDPATLGHIIWRCPIAQGAWAELVNRWTWRAETAQLQPWIFFQPEPPAPARELRRFLDEEQLDHAARRTVISLTWRILCTIVSHQLWLARNNSSFRNTTTTAESFSAILWATARGQLTALAASMRTDGDHDRRRLGCGVLLIVDHLAKPSAKTASDAMVRLYYDGGARGNPGVSGAGYVSIANATGQLWEVVHGEAIYCGKSNTNNVTEHMGVARGLEECARRYGGTTISVQVVGDSALVARQLNGTNKVRVRKLQPLAARSATVLTGLFDYQIMHARRAGNKMADYLANVAMDAGRNVVVDNTTSGAGHATRLCEFLRNDLRTNRVMWPRRPTSYAPSRSPSTSEIHHPMPQP